MLLSAEHIECTYLCLCILHVLPKLYTNPLTTVLFTIFLFLSSFLSMAFLLKLELCVCCIYICMCFFHLLVTAPLCVHMFKPGSWADVVNVTSFILPFLKTLYIGYNVRTISLSQLQFISTHNLSLVSTFISWPSPSDNLHHMMSIQCTLLDTSDTS